MSDADPFDDADRGGEDEAVEDPFDDADRGGEDEAVEDPFAALGEGVGDASAADGPDDPFADLDAEAAVADDGDPFEEMDVGEVGEEDVWAALDEGAGVGAGESDLGDGDAGGTRSVASGDAAGEEHVVDKRSHCQQCPHFSSPPDTACEHDGTAIVEAVDLDRFRVRNCPMVDVDDPAFDGE